MHDLSPDRLKPLPFVDLQAQRERLAERIEAAIARVLDHGQFILGPEVAALERRLTARAGVAHCVTCSSGTDALIMALMAHRIGPGDAVLVPAFTFVASVEAIVLVGATPVFVDIEPGTFTIDPAVISSAIEKVRDAGLRPAAIIAVDLFGHPADYAAIAAEARAADLLVIADAAQSFGASRDGRPVGSLAPVTATSFYPAKPLGCYGDGGAVFTDDSEIAGRLRSIANHGSGAQRYEHLRIGLNARLDTIQAAVLLEKLEIFDDEIVARNSLADRYTEAFSDLVTVPRTAPGVRSIWAQYTIRVTDRDRVVDRLRAAGIPSAVYYPIPMHRQPAYIGALCANDVLAASEQASQEVLSLPMHPYLNVVDVERVIATLRAALG